MEEKVQKFVRSSEHTTKFARVGKLNVYIDFLQEYRRIAEIYINYIWNNKYEYIDSKNVTRICDIQNDLLDVPGFFDYNLIPVPNNCKLSGRAKSSLITQCCGIVKAVTEKRKRLLYKKNKLIQEKQIIPEKFLELIKKCELTKPKSEKINPELSSKNIEFEEETKHFNLFIKLKCLGDFDNIHIPIKLHKQANKWKKIGRRMGSVLLTSNSIHIRWECEKSIKSDGNIVGADQGKLDILSLSDGQVTKKTDIHGHSLDSILKKMSKRRKGSKAFQKVQDHRENFINWSINNLNFESLKQLNYEEVRNIRYKKCTNRVMSHWAYTIIEEKSKRKCEENGVHFHPQPSAYRSQRCSECGWVHAKNRKKKCFKCLMCGTVLDSDINASLNHEIELPFVPDFVMHSRMSYSSGFFWKPEEFFTKEGEELRVPLSNNQEINIL